MVHLPFPQPLLADPPPSITGAWCLQIAAGTLGVVGEAIAVGYAF